MSFSKKKKLLFPSNKTVLKLVMWMLIYLDRVSILWDKIKLIFVSCIRRKFIEKLVKNVFHISTNKIYE